MIPARTLVRIALAIGVAACSSTTVTTTSGPIILTGSYGGFQEGTDGEQSFEDDPFELTIVQDGDSITGSYLSTFGGIGTLAGVILPSDSILEFTLEMVQTQPCDGLFTGIAEARVGVQTSGLSTIGIIGNYVGDDCDSTTDAAFFVVRGN